VEFDDVSSVVEAVFLAHVGECHDRNLITRIVEKIFLGL
jgi:hypothetical protein